MAALTQITSAIVRSTLGVAFNAWSLLVKSSAINKWSRYKPVRGNWPAGTSGKYGLNLPTDWSYLQPRGGGSNSEPTRAGDFRGYEHDKDVAGPVIYCINTEAQISASYTPAVGVGLSGQCVCKMNTAHESVRIIPSDLGVNNYYWGLNINGYCKTLGTVLANGAAVSFGITLDLTDPEDPSFTDLPYMEPGTITWELFISSAAQTSWASGGPAGYIKLPGGAGETWGSKTIVSSGTFTLNNWIAVTVDVMNFTWDEAGYGDYIGSIIVSTRGTWHIDTIPAGFTVKDALGNTLAVNSTGDSGDEIRVFPTEVNTGDTIGDLLVIHDSNNDAVNITIAQGPSPATYLTITDNGTDSVLESGETAVDFDFYLNNTHTEAITVDVRLVPESEVAGDFGNAYPFSNMAMDSAYIAAESSLQFESYTSPYEWFLGDVVDDGVFSVNLQVSFDGITWITVGTVASGLSCWSNI